tara:strand:+ start:1207 stop:2013 length:807 start_codon:yes stop_codon:yes gene_type:complete
MIRRRGRRKKSDIVNFSIDTNDEHKVTFNNSSETNIEDDTRDQTKINFGNLNIVVHSIKESEVFEPILPKGISMDNNFSLEKKDNDEIKSKRCLINLETPLKYPEVEEVVNKELHQKNCLATVFEDKIEIFPKKSKHCCWWCCHKFETTPCYVPTHYDSQMDSFKVKGNFCSWNCAKSYILDSNDSTKYRKCQHLTYLVFKLTGKYISISCAPPREKLTMFGGNEEIEDFRKNHKKVYFDLTPSFGLIKLNTNYEERHLHKLRRITTH